MPFDAMRVNLYPTSHQKKSNCSQHKKMFNAKGKMRQKQYKAML